MKTDLKTQLARYGEFHRSEQAPVEIDEVFVEAVASSVGPNFRMRRTVVGFGAAAFVALLIGVPAILLGGPTASDTAPLNVPSTEPVVVDVPTAQPVYEGYAMVQQMDDGTLVGIKKGAIWRSHDSGESWNYWYSSGIEVLFKVSGGPLVAIRNHDGTMLEGFGENSNVNASPEAHSFDPATQEWTVTSLPRPELPPDLEPASMDPNDTECELGGLQSWVDGIAGVSGASIVVLGDHRIVGEGICYENFQVMWVSDDGVNWDLIPDLGVVGYLADLVWTGEQYIGIGSDRFVGGGGPVPRIWTSDDLSQWTERPVDLTMLPEDAFTSVPAAGAVTHEGRDAFLKSQENGTISVGFDVLRYRPGLDESITSLEELEQWLADVGQPEQTQPSLGELLELDGVDFPLDVDELNYLNSLFNPKEPYGTFTISSTDGSEWTADYQP